MKQLNLIFTIIFAGILLLTSCEKKEIEAEEIEAEENEDSSNVNCGDSRFKIVSNTLTLDGNPFPPLNVCDAEVEIGASISQNVIWIGVDAYDEWGNSGALLLLDEIDFTQNQTITTFSYPPGEWPDVAPGVEVWIYDDNTSLEEDWEARAYEGGINPGSLVIESTAIEEYPYIQRIQLTFNSVKLEEYYDVLDDPEIVKVLDGSIILEYTN